MIKKLSGYYVCPHLDFCPTWANFGYLQPCKLIPILLLFFRYGKERKNAALAHLTRNINSRDVRGGHFELPIDPKGQLGDLSLNKSQAYTIMAPPEDFKGKHYNHILDNVCSCFLLVYCKSKLSYVFRLKKLHIKFPLTFCVLTRENC